MAISCLYCFRSLYLLKTIKIKISVQMDFCQSLAHTNGEYSQDLKLLCILLDMQISELTPFWSPVDTGTYSRCNKRLVAMQIHISGLNLICHS